MQPNLAPPAHDALAKVVEIILQARERRLYKASEPPGEEQKEETRCGQQQISITQEAPDDSRRFLHTV